MDKFLKRKPSNSGTSNNEEREEPQKKKQFNRKYSREYLKYGFISTGPFKSINEAITTSQTFQNTFRICKKKC